MTGSNARPLSRACFVAAAAALGHALQISNGFYNERALAWLTGALALALIGVAGLRHRSTGSAYERWLLAGTGAAIAWQIVSLLTAPPGMYLSERASFAQFHALIAAEAVLVGVAFLPFRLVSLTWFPALLVVHLAAGVWMLRASPDPRIDVVVVHREAYSALRNLRSPYQISFENIYGRDSGFYNPQLLEGNRVKFGYPYPPATLLLAAPGHAIAGDYRYAHLVALVAAAAFIGFSGSTLFPKLVAVLLLTQPRGFFVLEQGWTEPIALCVLAITLLVMRNWPAAAPWAGGLLIVTKQYLALAAFPLYRFASSRGRTRGFLLYAALAAIIVTLPFVLWEPRSFVESVLLLQTREPFRIDSLSYLSWAARQEWGAGTFVWAIGAAAIGLAFAMALAPPTPLGCAATLACSTFAMFALGSKAFCNYYFFVAGALCCAAAHAVERASGAEEPDIS
jgi:hypothetical protein